MKKRIISLLLTLVMALSLFGGTAHGALSDYPIPEYGAIEEGTAVDRFDNGELFVISHRCAWRNGPENSLLSIYAAIQIGVDMVELDVRLSSDGVPVLLHDETLKQCVVDETDKIQNYTWEQLSAVSVEPKSGGTNKPYLLTAEDVEVLNSLSNYAEHCGGPAVVGGTMPLTRLDDAIELIGDRMMINLDKCTDEATFITCYILFRETDMLDNVLFKNTNSVDKQLSWYESAAQAWNEKYPEDTITMKDVQDSVRYCRIYSASDVNLLKGHVDAGTRLEAVEFSITSASAEAAVQSALAWCRENGIHAFVNTIPNSAAIGRADSETAWAELIDHGYTGIQTDRPSELVEYLTETHRTTRDAGSIIEAEHFSDFSYDDGFTLYVPVGADSNMNKVVSNIHNGEWMEYDNVVFDGGERLLELNISGVNPLSYVQVYIDNMTKAGLVAEKKLSEGSTVSLRRAVTTGKHTVYLKFIGAPDVELLKFDSFAFIGRDELAGDTVAPIVMTTSVGTAPDLPSSISRNGYELDVKWESISPANYAQAGYFTVLGYVYALRDYVRVIVIVKDGAVYRSASVPSFLSMSKSADSAPDSDGLLVWLDGSEGLSHTDGTVTRWVNQANSEQIATVKGGAPLYVSDAKGGKAGVYFDGKSKMMISLEEGVFNDLEGITMIVYGVTDTKYLSSTETSNDNNWRSQRRSLLFAGDEGGGWGSLIMGVYSDRLSGRVGTGVNQDYGFNKARDEIMSGFSSTAIVWDGPTKAYTAYVNGGVVPSGSSKGTVSNHISNDLYIGEGKDASTFGGWKGTVTEVLIYDRALTESEVAAVNAYFEEKYGAVKSVTGVEMDVANTEQVVAVGDSLAFSASTIPEDADNKNLIWHTSDETVATVDNNGVVTAHSAGLAIISVSSAEGGYTAGCAVKVNANANSDIWEDITNMCSWAVSADPDDYDGWDAMESALEQAAGVNSSDSADSLREVYALLREAMLGLSAKGHSHTYGEVYTVIEGGGYTDTLELYVCEECGHCHENIISAKGDVDGNRAVNIIDLTLTARYIAQCGADGPFDLTECNEAAMDYNRDGVIDQLDLNEISMAILYQ